MSGLMKKDAFSQLGVVIPEILLPNHRVDLQKWAVVACDQFTSQLEYWEEAAQIVGEEPSTLKIIFPEVYLGKGNDQERINTIRQQMREYLQNEVLINHGPCMIYVERRTAYGNLRKGLVLAVDLECYDYNRGSTTLIRATEGTVLERIPPRVKIRDGAILESPHVMLLIDDPECQVIEPITAIKDTLEQVYDFDLMLNGGRLTGYKVDRTEIFEKILAGLTDLADLKRFNQKYNINSDKLLLFAVGDGNHSLATAKAVWEKVKQENANDAAIMDHPARYALVEVVNIHDSGLQFEPIHRVLFNIEVDSLFNAMKSYFSNNEFELSFINDSQAVELQVPESSGPQVINFVSNQGNGLIKIKKPVHNLAVGTLQAFIDDYIARHQGVEVDYIHGTNAVVDLGCRPGNIGFLLPSMDKSDLFKTVIIDGVLPRKTFSMGEAEEKRYYMECRQIS